MKLSVGDPAPSFELPNQDREMVTLDELQGRKSLIVFIPFPFTGICEGELCVVRDNLAGLAKMDANVVAITPHAVPTIKKWADDNHFSFSVLSDYWPHGEITKAYGAFDEKYGSAKRYTFVLDDAGVIRNIVASEALGIGREFDEYTEALAAI